MGASMLRLMLIPLVFLSGLAYAKPSERLPLPQELQADELPWFAFTAQDGKGEYNDVINRDNLKALAKKRNSKRVVFSFFATWCVPCREGLKRMSEKADELKRQGILVVLVNVAEKDLKSYSYGDIDGWARQYIKEDWLLGFNKFSNSLEKFGLAKSDSPEAPLPRTLVTDADLRPIMLIGTEGDDFPQILWKGL